jgi:hypothetical protein
MTVRGTAFLVGFLVALAGYLWMVELRSVRAAAPTGAAAAPLLAVPPTDVARVELAEGERRLTAIRGEHGWTDGAGRAWSGGAVSDLVDALGTLRPVATFGPDAGAPADYGLGPGARRLELTGSDGRPLLALELGERNPAWTGLYARRVGETAVLLVGGVLGWDLDKLRQAAPAGDP